VDQFFWLTQGMTRLEKIQIMKLEKDKVAAYQKSFLIFTLSPWRYNVIW